MREVPVIFENDFCLVLDKPSGLAVQGGKGVGVSLDSILAKKMEKRPFLVHRLDKDTSGLILTAKTKEAAAFFSGLFSEEAAMRRRGEEKAGRRLIKRYLGVCAGIPSPDEGYIDAALTVRGKELQAGTSYRLVSSGKLEGLPLSLLELELKTGRMHQIRRHLAGIGHPLLGDDKYGDFSLNKKLRKTCSLKYLLLHASRLIVPPSPPFIPEGLDAVSPLPEYFRAAGRLDPRPVSNDTSPYGRDSADPRIS